MESEIEGAKVGLGRPVKREWQGPGKEIIGIMERRRQIKDKFPKGS